MISIRRLAAALLGFATFVVAAPGSQAQLIASNTRWQAWIGCWRQDDLPPSAPTVCVVPTSSASAVDVVTVDSGKVVSRYTVDASGRQHAVNRDGCAGWERAQWSNDSLRVFLTSELMCGALKRSSTGVISLSPNGEWLSIDAVRAGQNGAVRATHYRAVDAPVQVSQEIALASTLGLRLDRRTAAIAASARLTAGSIIEAAHALDTTAMQAWLVERHETYNLTAQTLITLADAGVPGSVTDVMVAASYPEEFHFGRGDAPRPMTILSPADSARIAADYLFSRSSCDPLAYYSPYGWGVNPCDPYYNAYRYGYGYPGYRYGYGSGLGYGYGYGYGAGYYGGVYTGPVVILSNSTGTEHGRAVKGQGYTRGSSGSSGSSSSGSSASSSSSSSGSSGSSSSSSSGSSSSSSSSGRTAHARPPT
jgi:hypothetical protein